MCGCGWKKFVGLALVAGVLALGAWLGRRATPPAHAAVGQYAIVLQAGTESHEGMARAVHAFLYAQELREHGHDVVLIFDGAGTQWAAELSDPASDSTLKPMYEAVRSAGVIEIICDYCAGAFGVHEALADRDAALVGEYAGHPSVARWADQGYALLIL